MLLFAWLVSLAHAEDGWVAKDADLLRWADGKAVSAQVHQGDEVEVLLRENGKARVRKGTDFGWLAEANLSAIPVSAPLDLPDLPFPTGGLPGSSPFGASPLPGAPPAP